MHNIHLNQTVWSFAHGKAGSEWKHAEYYFFSE